MVKNVKDSHETVTVGGGTVISSIRTDSFKSYVNGCKLSYSLENLKYLFGGFK